MCIFHLFFHSPSNGKDPHTLYLNNVSFSLSPKFLKTFILLCVIDFQGLYFRNEKGPSETTAENITEAFIISDVKLFKRKQYHILFLFIN